MSKNFFKNQNGSITLLVIALVVVLGIILTGGLEVRSPSNVKPTPTPFVVGIPLPPPAQEKKNSLQLGTVAFQTITPTTPASIVSPTTTLCQLEGTVTNGCTCPENTGYNSQGGPVHFREEECSRYDPADCDLAQQCHSCNAPTTNNSLWGLGKFCHLTVSGVPDVLINCLGLENTLSTGVKQCVGYPVIYLYPTKDTLVYVKLTIPGIIYKSIPAYPKEGWRNVLAHPNGQLEYENQTYSELYYESQVKNIAHPHTGIIIAKTELAKQLLIVTGKLGLLPTEQQEFLDYWMPKLQNLKANYILFSVIDTTEKERIDHVDITPKPYTFIAFLAYFKPLDFPVAVAPLVLSQTPPARIGFTAVEWGGTIDN